MKKKALLSAVLTLAVCLCLIAGSTYALFTSQDSVNIAVTAGEVSLTANLDSDSMLTWSLYETEADARTDGKFANTGTATITDEAHVVIERMTPGDVAKFKIDVTNTSNVSVQYRVRMISNAVEGKTDLTPALVTTAYIDGNLYPVSGTENATVWRFIDAGAEIEDIWVTVSFPNHDTDGSIDNYYQEAVADINFVVEAVQGNAYDYEYAVDQSNLLDAEGYLPEGVLNGEGATIYVEDETVGLAGTSTLANVTVVDATNGNSLVSTLWDVDDGVDTTLILADGASVIAREDALAIHSSMVGANETFTLFVEDGAKIAASGENGAAVYAQGWAGCTANIILNGSADECFDLSNGATGMVFIGEDGDVLVVNIFVKDAAAMAEYADLIYAQNAAIAWFVNGTYAQTTYH